MNPMLNARHRLRCRKTRPLLSDYLDGELDPGRNQAVAGHLDQCPECGRMARNLSRMIDALRHFAQGSSPAVRPGPAPTEPIA